MNKKNYIQLFTFLVASFMMISVQAQKFGYVNTQDLLQNLPEVKEANSNIEAYQTQLQKKGQEMLQSFQAKYQDLERKQAQGEISPKQLEVEAQKLKEEENKILEFDASSQQKILEKSETLLSPIRDRVQNAIDAVASENGFDYIFDYSTGFILFADESADVSSMVKSKLGI